MQGKIIFYAVAKQQWASTFFRREKIFFNDSTHHSTVGDQQYKWYHALQSNKDSLCKRLDQFGKTIFVVYLTNDVHLNSFKGKHHLHKSF